MSNNLTREKKRQHQVCKYQDWSKLFPDVLRQILESLNVLDFTRAKTVCSDWYSVWRTCIKPTRYPWRFISPRDDFPMLFDPKEGKIHETKPLELDISSDHFCLTTSGNWFLMVDSRIDFYLLNVLTRERINLPSLESLVHGGQARFHRIYSGGYFTDTTRLRCDLEEGMVLKKDLFSEKRSSIVSVFSINEKKDDYFVALLFKKHYLFTIKKGDSAWRNLNTKGTDLEISAMAYKSNKLYLLTSGSFIDIIDFSGALPKKVYEENPYRNHRFRSEERVWKTKIAIRNSGEVLIIQSLKVNWERLFDVYKMDIESKKWEKIKSFGDDNEMLIFGQGVTIRAPVQDVDNRFKSDSILFADCDVWNNSPNCGVFDLATKTYTTYKNYGYSAKTWWFVPG